MATSTHGSQAGLINLSFSTPSSRTPEGVVASIILAQQSLRPTRANPPYFWLENSTFSYSSKPTVQQTHSYAPITQEVDPTQLRNIPLYAHYTQFSLEVPPLSLIFLVHKERTMVATIIWTSLHMPIHQGQLLLSVASGGSARRTTCTVVLRSGMKTAQAMDLT